MIRFSQFTKESKEINDAFKVKYLGTKTSRHFWDRPATRLGKREAGERVNSPTKFNVYRQTFWWIVCCPLSPPIRSLLQPTFLFLSFLQLSLGEAAPQNPTRRQLDTKCWKWQVYGRTWYGMCPHLKAALVTYALVKGHTSQENAVTPLSVSLCFLSVSSLLSSFLLHFTSSSNLSFPST